MKKVLAVIVAFGLLLTAGIAGAKSSFDPVDEPTTPFERIVYYTKDLTPNEKGVQGLTARTEIGNYAIFVKGTAMYIAYTEQWAVVAAGVTEDGRYLIGLLTPFFSAVEEVSREDAEGFANGIFAMAEEDGCWFRRGYVLYWKRDLGNMGGY